MRDTPAQLGEFSGRSSQTVRESELERALREKVALARGRAPKWVSPGLRGVPDRIVLIPGQQVQFVELKAPGEPLRDDQARMHTWLAENGFSVWTIDSLKGVERFMWYHR